MKGKRDYYPEPTPWLKPDPSPFFDDEIIFDGGRDFKPIRGI